LCQWSTVTDSIVTDDSVTIVLQNQISNFKFRLVVLLSFFVSPSFMHTQSNANVERDVLPKIQRTAVAMLELLSAGSHISKPTPILDTSSMTLDLTFPHDIIAPIMKLPEGIREELLGCLTNRLNELQQQFLSLFRSTCSTARNANDLDGIRQAIRNVYYTRCILPLQHQLSRLPDISKHQQKNRSGKRTFNNVSGYGFSHVYPQPQS
jgi:hypothetical protein